VFRDSTGTAFFFHLDVDARAKGDDRGRFGVGYAERTNWVADVGPSLSLAAIDRTRWSKRLTAGPPKRKSGSARESDKYRPLRWDRGRTDETGRSSAAAGVGLSIRSTSSLPQLRTRGRSLPANKAVDAVRLFGIVSPASQLPEEAETRQRTVTQRRASSLLREEVRARAVLGIIIMERIRLSHRPRASSYNQRPNRAWCHPRNQWKLKGMLRIYRPAPVAWPGTAFCVRTS